LIVVDTSAILSALVGRPHVGALRDRLGPEELHAPHLLDVEFLHGLRRLVAGKQLSLGRAEEAREDLDDLAIIRYPHSPLADRIWQLRDALSSYDAAFVALAEALGAPLITCDGRLARSAAHSAAIELFG